MKTKTIQSSLFLFLLSSLCLFSACNGSSKQNNNEEQSAETATVYTVDDALENAESLVGQEISIKGLCTHICAHGGGKIFLVGEDPDKALRIEADEALGRFPEECVNSTVEVHGKMMETRVDEAYLQDMEKKAAEAAKKHGDGKGAGCDAEKKANAEKASSSMAERIANFRKQIEERNEKEGKAYLSFFYVEAGDYKIQ